MTDDSSTTPGANSGTVSSDVRESWDGVIPIDDDRTFPFFRARTSEAGAPPPPVKVCPTPDCEFFERAAQRVRVWTAPSTLAAGDRRHLVVAGPVVPLALLLALVVPVAGWAHVLAAGVLISLAASAARLALPPLWQWVRTTGKAEAEFVHSFEHRSCPRCGRKLIDHCKQCAAMLIRPNDGFCWNCGIKYWWAVRREEHGKEILGETEWRSAHRLRELDDGRVIFDVVASVSRIAVDALVSTDKSDGQMSGQVGVHLYAIGGEGIETESIAAVRAENPAGREQSFPRTGEAWRTGAGALPAHHVVHVAMVGLQVQVEDVRTAIGNCLRVAALAQPPVRSIALPVLGTGRGNLTMSEAAQAFELAFADWAHTEASTLKEIVIIFREEEEALEFRRALEVRRPDAR